ncbi:NADH dehydrogenase [ubiquinone] 1 alpha subcomplex subunit 13 [Culicoides brevitarsis]|uniref:NADH dehydrogenase [ubiquinone] 1 alpha subcomplex subunit 13 n=1 Tax=Culicoides brevitarsis TaxID=469753 RepID=UPI00307B9E0B
MRLSDILKAAQRLQDLPPEGGYEKIVYKRVPVKTYFSGRQMFIGYVGITIGALYLFYLNDKKLHCEDIENRSAVNVLYPILLAERDREYLKQLRRNRDEEAELMKNVKGWEVGTWYGEPVYKLLPKDTLVDPHFSDFYAHCERKHLMRRYNLKMWN